MLVAIILSLLYQTKKNHKRPAPLSPDLVLFRLFCGGQAIPE